jgi:hypothetical protein
MITYMADMLAQSFGVAATDYLDPAQYVFDVFYCDWFLYNENILL